MDEAFQILPLTPLRKVIAARMTEAKRTIPHFRLSAEIEFDALQHLRQQFREEWPQHSVSMTDLLVKACAAALMAVPAVNAQWAETEIHQFPHADISVVTAVEGGLLTPIVRSAESKSIWELSTELRALIRRANLNALKTSEINGGSFSLSNLGMHGVDQFDAVINAPQCAILAVGAAKPRQVTDAAGTRVASVAWITLSVDHRAIDGVTGARFLSALKHRIEHPEQILGGFA